MTFDLWATSHVPSVGIQIWRWGLTLDYTWPWGQGSKGNLIDLGVKGQSPIYIWTVSCDCVYNSLKDVKIANSCKVPLYW